MVKIPLPAGSYPTDGYEIVDFLYWPGRKINRYGLYFDGVDDKIYVDITNKPTINTLFNNGEWSFIFYGMKYSGGYDYSDMLDIEWHIPRIIWRNGGFMLSAKIGGTYTTILNYDYSNALDNKLLLTFEQSEENNFSKLYINASNVLTAEYKKIDAGGNAFYIAAVSSQEFFKGDIYFTALYNRALSDDEITAVYNYLNNNGGYLPLNGLVLLYDFTEHGSSTLYDKSGWGNHGTIYGATWLDEPSGKVDAFMPVVEG